MNQTVFKMCSIRDNVLCSWLSISMLKYALNKVTKPKEKEGPLAAWDSIESCMAYLALPINQMVAKFDKMSYCLVRGEAELSLETRLWTKYQNEIGVVRIIGDELPKGTVLCDSFMPFEVVKLFNQPPKKGLVKK